MDDSDCDRSGWFDRFDDRLLVRKPYSSGGKIPNVLGRKTKLDRFECPHDRLRAIGGRRVNTMIGIGREHGPQKFMVAAVEGFGQHIDPGIELTGQPLDLLADREITNAKLAQIDIHIGDHEIDQRLGGGAADSAVLHQPPDHQTDMQRQDFETALRRIRHLQGVIVHGVARIPDRRGIELMRLGRGGRVDEERQKTLPGRASGGNFGLRLVVFGHRAYVWCLGQFWREGMQISWSLTRRDHRAAQNRRKSLALPLAGMAVLSSLALSACTPTIATHGHTLDEAAVAQIEPGRSSRQDVLRLLGSPSSLASFDDDAWYYVSQRTEKVSFYQEDLVEQDVITVTFNERDLVDEVQRHGLEQAAAVDPVDRVTPTAGEAPSVLEQFIGNIGRFGNNTLPDGGR